ncbi:LamG-like jellyroll fold domain-containing protein [uncultured Lacinutrix sp.]|uniref:LamG-like jellyroll fold domain-containing protein n=1 Tax=uncultured Lacinutrix sp. TaxID=574032 RepID=UPI00262C3B95|nr:LamG-like jellyroll fold domain-containing protein [uncultured Lacinutrix sp.]
MKSICFSVFNRHAITKNKTNYGTLMLSVFLCFFVFQVFSQTTIVKNEFIATGYTNVNNGGQGVNNGGDNWNFTATINNGQIRYTTDKFISPTRSLEIIDYYEDLEKVEFDQIDITGLTNVEFSFGYASNNALSANDRADLIYYIDGVPTTVTLIQGGNGEVNFGSNVNNGTGVANAYVLSIPNGSTSFSFDIELIADSSGGNEIIYIDDAFLTHIVATSNPPVANCQDITIELDSNGDATIVSTDVDNMLFPSSDDGTIVSYSIDIDTFNCTNVGTPVDVTLTVTDNEGQTDTCISTVTVNNYSGTMVAPTLPDVNAYCSYTVPTPADLSFRCNLITPTFLTSSSGSTTFTSSGSIVWVYNNGPGETVQATQNVIIEALVPPNNIAISTITESGATISWDDFLGEETYIIRYRKTGTTTWSSITATTNTANITGLDDLTEYDVEVSSACGAAESSYSTTYNFVTLSSGAYCTPVSSSNGVRYITNVTLPGETVDINYDSGDGGGYQDYTNIPAADLYYGEAYDISILIEGNENLFSYNHRSGWVAYIDFNQNDIFDDGERVYRSGGAGGGEENQNPYPFAAQSFIVPATAVSGVTTMRIGLRQYWSPGDPCGTTGVVEDFEDYKVKISLDPFAPQDITVVGNNTEIVNGQTTTTFSSFTDFGVYDINGGAKTRVFKIINSGSNDLILGALPVALQLGSSTDFTVTAQPVAGTTIAPGGFETFSVSFDPSTITSNITAVVVIDSNDPDENPFTYTIIGEGAELYPDTDGDGISNNIDVDDDNDGISDSEEQLQCLMYSNASVVETQFLNETFGSGINRIAINGNTDGVTTSYCYEDGINGQTGEECDADVNLNDGEYAVHYSITNGDATNNAVTANGENIATFGYYAWYKGEDHTPGDTNGRMAIFNGDVDPGVFYETAVSGILPNVPINYSFWAINIDNADNRFSGGELPRINPNITINFLTSDYSTVLASFDTGDITRCTSGNNCVDSVWKEFGTSLSINESEFVIQFVNNSPGGLGNDLAIDDINITQSLCDLDGDGVADVFDLDNDNDGIPNIYEYGPPFLGADIDLDANGVALIGPGADTDGNGMSDIYETATALDTDNDGTPDYVDLDSDNDSIFDAVENDGNGDIDVDGDGVGDGSDISTGINNDDFDGDGVLAIIDSNDDDGDADDHGLGTNGYQYPLDTDGDGVPDYLDVDSNDAANNPADGNDIDNTLYDALDTDNDGIVDGNIDADNDGLLSAFDSEDNLFGGPRDLDNSYSLFFDGRNDYVEDANVTANGNATITAWIKSEGDNTLNTNRIVAGQNNFYLIVNDSDSSVTVMLNGAAILTSTDFVTDAIWVHVAATTNGSQTVLYVNGEAQGSPAGSGGVNNDTSNFTIGRLANTDSNYFHGEIDEVRVFDIALTEEEIQRTVYQELEETQNFNQGKIIPKDISANAIGGNLLRYYKMDGYKGDITDNKVTPAIDQITGAKLYNIKDIYFQTAPLPYQTVIDGAWSTTATWLHGDVWDITDEVNNKAWSIVDINNNVDTDTSHTTLGLFVEAGKEFEVNTDAEIKNTWYLELNGFIDLAGESQLVQTNESDLVLGANGKLERDQQGTENLYTYNYFSSPVHSSDTNAAVDGNEIYTVGNVMMDGTDPINPVAINFIGGYDGNNATSPIQTARFWLWKYSNLATDYYNWEQVFETGDIKVGEGYSMKGPGTGAVTDQQNYTFSGKPNNGTILLPITTDNTYLVGNPYASALDGDAFILDNLNLSGLLYFWEHFAGGTHNTLEYEGGYGFYNLSGGVPAIQHNYLTGGNEAGGAQSLKTPGRYVPVGQGFFVEGISTGDIKFENDQRIFVKEAGNTESIFFRNDSNNTTNEDYAIEDLRTKFRFSFISPETYKRQLLLTVDENTTIDYDWGYDAKIDDDNVEDMFWSFANDKFVIQGTNETTDTTVLPLSVKTVNGGIIEIGIDALENVDPTLDIYLKDNDIYHNLRNAAYTVTVESGVIDGRFEIVFTPDPALLSVEEFQENNSITMFASNGNLTVNNPLNKEINNIQVINMLGQIVLESQVNTSDSKINIPMRLQTGAYLFKLTSTSFTITKKVVINSK